MRAEVRDEQRVRPATPRSRRGCARQASRSMSGGGVGGRTTPLSRQLHAGRVADERNAGVVAEVRHVMGRVARRVDDVQVAAADADPLAAGERHDRVRSAPAASRPRAGPSRRPRGASRWRSDSPARPCAAHRARARRRESRGSRARVCRSRRRDRDGCASARIAVTSAMDMPARRERRSQRRQRARRPRVEKRDAAGSVQDRRGDDARHALEVKVDIRDP